MAAFIREGLTVAHLTPGGIKKRKGSDDMTVPQFSMPATAVPGIAQVIVNAWQNHPDLNKILERSITGAKKGWPRMMQFHKPQRQSMRRYRDTV